MMVREPTFLLLDVLNGWRSAVESGAAAGETLRLAADPAGPLSLHSSDGSLGRLRLPRRLAVDPRDGGVYLLERESRRILRYDTVSDSFQALPNVGGEGDDARQFGQGENRPNCIAIAGGLLYVANHGTGQLQIFDLVSLALFQIFNLGKGSPIDLFGSHDRVYILAGKHQRVYRHEYGRDQLETVHVLPPEVPQFTRLLVDRDGVVYLFDAAAGHLHAPGQNRDPITDAQQIRGKFDMPLLYVDHKGRFAIPDNLLSACGPLLPEPPLTPESGEWLDSVLFLYQTGRRLPPHEIRPPAVMVDDSLRPRLYQRKGTWLSHALDSRVYQCQWHRIELALTEALPPNSRVCVATYCDHQLRAMDLIQDHMWVPAVVLEGTAQPRSDSSPDNHDCLIQSREGQYMWLKIELDGDGYTSPSLQGLTVHYPRTSYLEYLPAAYRFDDESRRFLERFLSIVQTEWDALEQRIEDIAALFDPDAVPAERWLGALADWLALPLEGEWNADQKRRMLAAAPALYSQRGTLAGLRGYLQVVLQNITGLSPREQGDYPVLIEGFRQRGRYVTHNTQVGLLWSEAITERLQLDVHATEGEVRLGAPGDPQRDLLHRFAHRFHVFVPEMWLLAEADRAMLRRAIEAEKPAQAAYELHLVAPSMVTDVESASLLGINTVLGIPRPVQLDGRMPLNSPQRLTGGSDPHRLLPGIPLN